MWPFSGAHAGWLVLYIVTWALHAVFVSYVAVGAVYALVRKDDVAERARDIMPFMLGAGITAGVAPLLFIQLLYQERFYTANLLLGPRWGAVVPALIIGFYALYLAKAKTGRLRTIALATAAVAFLFVAWSWTELHQVMLDDPAWRAMYAAGDRLYDQAGVLPRLALWIGAMPILFATISLWLVGPSRKLAIIALASHVIAGAAAFAIGHAPVAHGWLYVLFGAVAIEVVGWLLLVRSSSRMAMMLVTGATSAALLAGAVVREAPRLAVLQPARDAALEASGFPVFATTLVFGVLAIAFVVKQIRS
jgi:hypothetical protein